jgi:hypothetical protein
VENAAENAWENNWKPLGVYDTFQAANSIRKITGMSILNDET